MSRRMVGVLLLLGAGELFGLLLGQWFFSLFLKTVPPLALSSFNQSAAHAAFLFYGAASGLVLFGLAFLAALLAPWFSSPARS